MVYDVNIKKARGGLGFGLIFVLFGVFFLVILSGVAFSGIAKKNSLDGEVKASNITWESHYDSDNGTMYRPTYIYEVNGQSYSCRSNTSSSSQSGAKGTVYYNTSQPSECMTDFDSSTNFIVIIFLFLPIIFILVGGNQMKKALANAKKAKELAKSGVLVKGVPYEIINTGMAVNDRKIKAFAITYTFPDGQTRELKSQGIFDHVLRDRDGLCDFLYDPNNYDNYFIDLEINPTGIGSPNIIYYEHVERPIPSVNYTPNNNDTVLNNLGNYQHPNIYEQNGYNPNYYPQDGYNPNNKY